MGKVILAVEGKPKFNYFDKSAYTEDHDVPAVWIGGQIVAMGSGFNCWSGGKDEDHLWWELDENKQYRVTIEEIDE